MIRKTRSRKPKKDMQKEMVIVVCDEEAFSETEKKALEEFFKKSNINVHIVEKRPGRAVDFGFVDR